MGENSKRDQTMIEMGKQYRTRDGREVRIYAVDGSKEWPIHGAVQYDGAWTSCSWTTDGRHYSMAKQQFDLIEVKPKITRTYWLVHHSDGIRIYEQLIKPVTITGLAITGPHEVTFTEGEGL